MAPKAKITGEMIREAAFAIVKEEGHENLNARTIAKRLGCSTQPILYYFKTMDEIKQEVYHMADEYHSAYIMPDPDKAEDVFFLIAMNYIRFGSEEKNLFRFLFQANLFAGKSMSVLGDTSDDSPLLQLASSYLHCSVQEAQEYFLTVLAAVHGYASLLADNALEYDEKQVEKTIRIVFDGIIA